MENTKSGQCLAGLFHFRIHGLFTDRYRGFIPNDDVPANVILGAILLYSSELIFWLNGFPACLAMLIRNGKKTSLIVSILSYLPNGIITFTPADCVAGIITSGVKLIPLSP